MLKGVDTSPVVTAKVSAQGITIARQSLDESSSAYLCYDRVTSVIEGHTSFSVCVWGGGYSGACPGGAEGVWPPPRKKVIRANFKLFHLYFATFLVKNIIFSATPPPRKIEKQKKRLSDFGPPIRIPGHAPVFCY